jgi:hypothetical protein
MPVTPPGITRDSLGDVTYPLILMLVPEPVNLRLIGIHTAYRVTPEVPIINVAWLV